MKVFVITVRKRIFKHHRQLSFSTNKFKIWPNISADSVFKQQANRTKGLLNIPSPPEGLQDQVILWLQRVPETKKKKNTKSEKKALIYNTLEFLCVKLTTSPGRPLGPSSPYSMNKKGQDKTERKKRKVLIKSRDCFPPVQSSQRASKALDKNRLLRGYLQPRDFTVRSELRENFNPPDHRRLWFSLPRSQLPLSPSRAACLL